MKLHTNRLILREIENKDLNDLIKQANNINVARYLAVVPHPYTISKGKWFIIHCKKEAKNKPRINYEFAIELKSEKIFIGVISLCHVNYHNGTGTIGYWLGENYWRNGYMSEALEKVIDFTFSKIKLRRIDIAAFIENRPSNNLIKKFGFIYEGKRIKNVRAKSTGKIHDHFMYGMLKEDWIKRKIKRK
ncbi:hypothetical protein COU57_01320 [Candidatus Pacearchaeota archaeon CG10_big_fil_rev_8_21_14_0_10_32_14]|nr:MAG: hypothetical protein COU57_01320 [Candidatus Pacearchaeota archaeon CG10_big_fil_rev_8_21_14_0_10_32_14]